MRVRVRFFAGTRDAVGASTLEVQLPEASRVTDLVARLVREHPRLAPYAPHALLALDGDFVPAETTLREGAEVALMPPVSGGALQEDEFSLDELTTRLRKDGAGAVVSFTGIVRDTGGGEAPDARVARLHFEAYAPMAEKEIDALRAAATEKFGLTDCLVAHRIGTLEVGEPIVAVVTASAHRRAAFEAAMWMMDELKTRVPVWKREETTDGAARWVNDPTTGEDDA